jgi:hypothetical protein
VLCRYNRYCPILTRTEPGRSGPGSGGAHRPQRGDVIMPAIIDQAGRPFNVAEADGISRRHSRSEAAADCDQDCQEEDPARTRAWTALRPGGGWWVTGPSRGRPIARRRLVLDSGQTAPLVADGIRRRLPAPAVTGLSENCPKTAADECQLRATRAGEEGRFFVAFLAPG